MSEQNDPVAEIPEASNLVTSGEALPVDPATTEAPLSKRQWPWFVVVGVSAITGLSGYALGHTNGEGNHHQPPVGLNGPVQGGPNGGNFGMDPNGDHRNGGGKHRQHGPQMPGQPGAQGQGMPGQQMLPGQPMPGQPMPGQPMPGQPGMGIDPDGDNWSGTNQQGGPGAPVAPNVAPSASTSPTS